MNKGWYLWDNDALFLNLRIQPNAKKNEIVGPHGAALKVRINAPPVDGKANAQLLRFLAELFDVPYAHVSLLAGETGRDKRVRIKPRFNPDFPLALCCGRTKH